jgi:hypothetical protein
MVGVALARDFAAGASKSAMLLDLRTLPKVSQPIRER